MSRQFRIGGGLVDPGRIVSFSFDGKSMQGLHGDTLASALLANGRRLVARSFKYHRPRGILSDGSDEPNALVELRSGAHREPNTRATVVELFDGLEAYSQNFRLSLNNDLNAVNDLLSPFLSAGFYYKTFMWPQKFWERVYEPLIRSTAGLGSLSALPDPDCYDKGFLHCDLLVVGGGPAGLVVALVAGRAGARVILADEDYRLGGRLNCESNSIGDQSGAAWAHQAALELALMDNVRLMPRTTVYGCYDHGIFGAVERKTDHLASSKRLPRQVLWRIYSRRSVICAGATERSMAFANNDRPGIMLASAVRTYCNRYGVACGQNVAVFTCNNSGWRTAADLERRGIRVAAVIDTRAETDAAPNVDARIIRQGRIVNTYGRKALSSIRLEDGERLPVDCLAVSGGWNPNLQLTCHHRSKPQWNAELATFVPGDSLPAGMAVAGAAAGVFHLGEILKDAAVVASTVLDELDLGEVDLQLEEAADTPYRIEPLWHIKSRRRAWVDFQNDVTTKDIEQSHAEGMQAVEHLKRYTTLGMATDQGKAGNIPAIAIMADLSGKSIPDTGTTVYRPPYTPVAIGAFAGRSRGPAFRPVRKTPSHRWAKEHGAVFVEVGAWLRAQWYARPGESHWRQSVDREVKATRNSVGVCDVTTLGKIDIQGAGSTTLLNHVYTNGFSKLAVGKVRYGLMLREDGIAYDDGTTARLGENHYVMTTTTANAGLVFRQMEFVRQCLYPDLDVHIISTTDGWAQFSVAGPNSRRLLQKVVDPETDISNRRFPFMGCAEITICGGFPARLFRISFSGELAYEIAVPARYGNSMMETLIKAGEEFEAVPYGTEALGVMRVEKGHFAGNEMTGQTTALNLGASRMLSTKKDFQGSVLARRSHLVDDNALGLVGLRSRDKKDVLRAGAHLLRQGVEPTLENSEGWISSCVYSPTFGCYLGLGFINRGHDRFGETAVAVNPIHKSEVSVTICSPHFYDPDGGRQRG